MFKLVGLLVVLGVGFGLGYYVGQNRIDDLREAVVSFSRQTLDDALGMGTQQQLRWREGLIEAKGRVVQAKSEVMDRNFGNATRELEGALDSLEGARRAESNRERVARVRTVTTKIRHAKVRLSAGKVVSRSRLDEIQEEIDDLLSL